jgi:hypothetical protein
MGQIIDPNSLLLKTDQQPANVAFFNNLISQFCFAINGVGTRMDGYDVAEQNLINLGLANINSTLGPFLNTLQQAAQLGFLVAQADGTTASLSVGQPFELVLTSNGASLFTPTIWLMAMDVSDNTNWGVLELVSWVQEDLNLSTTCIYASKTKSSVSWQVCCGSGVLNAMVNDLQAATTAATNAQNAASSAQTNANYVQSVANTISTSGNVISVAGKAGTVTLVEGDIANLTSDLAARPTTTYVNSAVAGLQPHSSNLDQLASSTLTAFGFALFSAANAAAALTTLGAVGAASPTFTGAPKAPTQAPGDNSTNISTTAFVTAALTAALASYATTASLAGYQTTAGLGTAVAALGINSTQILAVFDDQTGTSYAFTAADNGRATTFTNASAITATLPNNLAKGWNTVAWQGGSGQVTFSPASGATLVNRQSKTKTAGQYAMVTLMVMSNSSGTNAIYALGGDAA